MVEINPPDARIRDFGSLNGTFVNDQIIGSREKGESPEQGQKRKYPEVDLKDGDVIRVGQTTLSVKIEADKYVAPLLCDRCSRDVSKEMGGRKPGAYICFACRKSIEVDPAQILRAALARTEAKSPQKDGMPLIAGYRIKRQIGVGGFGAVYLAERDNDQHPVAIKVMLARVAVDEDARRKFTQEIDLLKNLQHAHIVTILDSGSAGSAFFFVMEHCRGGSVAEYMEASGGKLSPAVALPIMIQALEGLSFAHAKSIVHRDLKPSNILLSGTPSHPVAKLADLGLAKNFERAGFSGMTLTGAYAGTPMFMPKEQVVNFKYVKPDADVWSIGATFYNMLSGASPRDYPKGSDPMEVILRGEIVPLSKRVSGIPRGIADVVDKAIQDNAKYRYQDGSEMLAALRKTTA